MMEAVGVALLSALCVLVGVVLAEVLREGQAPPVRATIRWTLGDVVFEGEGVSMEMFADQYVVGRVNPRTKHGQPAPIDGPVVVGLSNTDLAAAEVSTEDPKQFRVIGNPANVTSGVALEVNVSFDADLGEGQRTITRTGTIFLKPVEADDEHTDLEFGEPQNQEAPEAPPAPAVETSAPSAPSEPVPPATDPAPEEAHS